MEYFNNFGKKPELPKENEKKEIEKQEPVEVNKTFLVAKIIFLLFLITGIGIAGYYYWDINYNKKTLIDDNKGVIVDKSFSNLFNNPSDKDDNSGEDNGEVEYEENSCYVGGVRVESGKKILMYSREVVNPYQDCKDYAKERVCKNGFLLGDKSFSFVKCERNVDCQLPDGSILKNNETIKLYSKKVVPFGQTCERYALRRTCKNTVLSGDSKYQYRECKISFQNSCEFKDGHVLADGHSHTFYSRGVVPFGDKCSNYAKRFMCSKAAVLGGNIDGYQYWNCVEEKPKDCFIDGIIIPHGKPKMLYSKRYGTEEHDCNFYKEVRKCNNGILDGQEEYQYAKCYDN